MVKPQLGWVHWEMQVPGGNPGPTASPPGAVPLRGAKVQEKEPLKRGGTLQGAPPSLWCALSPCFWVLGCTAWEITASILWGRRGSKKGTGPG